MNPTIESLIAQAEVELDAARMRRERARATTLMIVNAAGTAGRPNLTAEEQQQAADARAARDQARADIQGIEDKLAKLRDVQAEEADFAAAQAQTRQGAVPFATPGTETGQPASFAEMALPARERAQQTAAGGGGQRTGQRSLPTYDGVARVGAEERTYHAGNDKYGRQFMMDVARSFVLSDPASQARLARHMAEERVERAAQYFERAAGDNTTANWAGLTVPQYLVDMYAPPARALRPFADVCNKHPLPAEGMALDISRITTGTSVANFANEVTDTVSLTSADDTLLTIPVLTAAGGQKVSRQAIERGRGIEDILMQDLFGAYATSLDGQLITTATTGLSAVANANTYTDTSPTVPEAYPKIMAAMAGVEGALLNMGYPDYAVMHSRRWYWFAAAMTSTWPFINSAGQGIPPQSGGIANSGSAYNSGVRGQLPIGLSVVVDNNIATNGGAGTNEDEIYVVPSRECHLWEDPGAPVFIRAEQPAALNLAILLVVYGYFAFTFSRYTNGMQKVSGTGLVTPVYG